MYLAFWALKMMALIRGPTCAFLEVSSLVVEALWVGKKVVITSGPPASLSTFGSAR